MTEPKKSKSSFTATLSKEYGGQPAYVWLAGFVGILLIWRIYKNKQTGSTGTQNTTGTASADQVQAPINQMIEDPALQAQLNQVNAGLATLGTNIGYNTTASQSNTSALGSNTTAVNANTTAETANTAATAANTGATNTNTTAIKTAPVPVAPKVAPTPAPKPAVKPAPRTYRVVPGDNLSAIATRYGTTWQAIYNLNKGVIGGNPNLIRPGQVFIIP